jgi:hypothetical protein
MEQEALLTLLAQIAMGFTLAACSGLRAFIPPLAVGLASRAGLIHLSGSFEWLGEGPTLAVLSVAVVFEVLGDKVPLLDHALDTAGTLLRPAAGALVGMVPLFDAVTRLTGGESSLSWVAGLAGGGAGAAVSVAVHLAKSQIRLGSTATTAGIANPVLSVVEDIVSLAGTVLSIFLPIIAAALLLMAVVLVARLVGRRRTPAH